MQFAKLNGVTLHHQLIGDPAAKPVIVFANSLGTDFRIWRDVIVRLAGDYAILAYDKRGHGLSDIGTAPYAIQDHVDDLAALLDHLQIGSAIIAGVSVGGIIAQGLFHTRPDLVRALILCDTADKVGTAEFWNERIAAIEADGINAMADAIMQRWFTPAFCTPENPDYDGYLNMLVRTTKAGYTGTCAAIRDADFTALTSSISVPTIAIVGAQDQASPPDVVRAMAKKISGCFFEEIDACGHLPSIEQPVILSEIIQSFIAKLPKGTPGE